MKSSKKNKENCNQRAVSTKMRRGTMHHTNRKGDMNVELNNFADVV